MTSSEQTDLRPAPLNGLNLSKNKNLFYSITLSLGAVIITLLALEIFIRVFIPQPEPTKWFESNEKYGYVLKKNFYQNYHFAGTGFTMEVKTNSLGLRDKEYDLTQTDAKRILLLGDSYTFGYGVQAEENFDSVLEEMLQQAGKRFIVMNTGVNGWGTLQQTLYGRDHLEQFRPDVVVITFCGNDPVEDLSFQLNMHDQEKGSLFYFPGKIFLRENSQLYTFLNTNVIVIAHNWLLNKKIAANNGKLKVDVQSANVITKEEWVATLGYIKAFYQDFIEFNPKGLLIVQATAPWQTDIKDQLSSLANGKNSIYLDLNNPPVPTPYRKLPFDNHWSKEMHAITAKHLFEVVQAWDAN